MNSIFFKRYYLKCFTANMRLPTITLIFSALALHNCVAFAGKTLDSVKQKDVVTCGVNTGLAGFAQADAQGKWSGLGCGHVVRVSFVKGREMKTSYKQYAVEMKPSGETHVTENGSKCSDGVYIPANSRAPEGKSEFCTVCSPVRFTLFCAHGKIRQNNAKIGKEQCVDANCISLVFFDPAKFEYA